MEELEEGQVRWLLERLDRIREEPARSSLEIDKNMVLAGKF